MSDYELLTPEELQPDEVDTTLPWEALLDAINYHWEQECDRRDLSVNSTLSERVHWFIARNGGPEAFTFEDMRYMERFCELSDEHEIEVEGGGDFDALFYYGNVEPGDMSVLQWVPFPHREMYPLEELEEEIDIVEAFAS